LNSRTLSSRLNLARSEVCHRSPGVRRGRVACEALPPRVAGGRERGVQKFLNSQLRAPSSVLIRVEAQNSSAARRRIVVWKLDPRGEVPDACSWQRLLCALAGERPAERGQGRAGTGIVTLSDKTTRHFVDPGIRCAWVFTSLRRASGDKTTANCHLGSSSRGEDQLQITSQQRLTTTRKKHVRTKREKPRAPASIVAFVREITRQNAYVVIGPCRLEIFFS